MKGGGIGRCRQSTDVSSHSTRCALVVSNIVDGFVVNRARARAERETRTPPRLDMRTDRPRGGKKERHRKQNKTANDLIKNHRQRGFGSALSSASAQPIHQFPSPSIASKNKQTK